MYQACIVFHWKACFCRSQAICATLVWMFFSSSQCFWRAGSLPVAASLIPQTGILLPLCSPSACITTSLCLKLFFFGFDSAVLLTLVIYWYLTFLGVISLWDMDISYLKSLFFFFFLSPFCSSGEGNAANPIHQGDKEASHNLVDGRTKDCKGSEALKWD